MPTTLNGEALPIADRGARFKGGPMRKRLTAMAAIMVLAGACGSSSAVVEAVEDLPPLPETPGGWVLVSGLGGSGSQFSGVTGIQFDGGDVAIHAACTGNGTLVVLILPASGDVSGAGPSAVFPCGGPGTAAVNRFELAGLSVPENATVRATVVEGAGTVRHAAYQVAVEQREP